MTKPNKLTPAEITAQITTLDRDLLAHKEHAAALALKATEGDKKAATEIAKVRAEIDAMLVDRQILGAALGAARERATIEGEAEATRRKEETREALQSELARLATTASKVDATIAKLKSLLDDLAGAETAARGHARALGGVLQPARVGQSGAADHAVSILSAFTAGLDRRVKIRPVADFVANGWANVLEAKETADAD